MQTGRIRPWEAYKSLDRTEKRNWRFVTIKFEIPDKASGEMKKLQRFSLEEESTKAMSRDGTALASSIPRHLFYGTELNAVRRLFLLSIETVRSRVADEADGSLTVSSKYCLAQVYRKLKKSKANYEIGSIDRLNAIFGYFFYMSICDEARESTGMTRSFRKDRFTGRSLRIPTSESNWRSQEAQDAKRQPPIEDKEVVIIPEDGGQPYTVRKRVYSAYQPGKPDPAVKSESETFTALPKANALDDFSIELSFWGGKGSIGEAESLILERNADAAQEMLLEEIRESLNGEKSVRAQRLRHILDALKDRPDQYHCTKKKWTFHPPFLAEKTGLTSEQVIDALRLISTRFGSNTPTKLAQHLKMPSLDDEIAKRGDGLRNDKTE